MPVALAAAPAVPGEPLDEEIVETWHRLGVTEGVDFELRHVEAYRMADKAEADWPWSVGVAVMEFIRAEPLESQLAGAITTALRAVPGVTRAEHDDREPWVLCGAPSGAALVTAVGAILDTLHPQLAAALPALG